MAEGLCRTADRIDPARIVIISAVLGGAQLRQILQAYARYYNEIRTHGSFNKDRRSIARFSGLEISNRTQSSADFITITCGFRFSVPQPPMLAKFPLLPPSKGPHSMTILMCKTSVPIFVQSSPACPQCRQGGRALRGEEDRAGNSPRHPALSRTSFRWCGSCARDRHAISGTARLAGAELMAFPNTEASSPRSRSTSGRPLISSRASSRSDRRHRGQGDRCQVFERRAQVQRADVPAKFLFAEFLFHATRLRYPAPLRHRISKRDFMGTPVAL